MAKRLHFCIIITAAVMPPLELHLICIVYTIAEMRVFGAFIFRNEEIVPFL